MFGGPPPPASAAEIRELENEASLTIQRTVFCAVLLYLSPFAVDTISSFL